MSRHVAVVRDATGLAAAAREIAAVVARLGRPPLRNGADGAGATPAVDPATGDDDARSAANAVWELRNMAEAAAAIAAAALRREESRGAHFRSDFPIRDPTLDGRHSILVDGRWRDGTLADARRRTSGVPA
jgi:L-aspartate oxidase